MARIYKRFKREPSGLYGRRKSRIGGKAWRKGEFTSSAAVKRIWLDSRQEWVDC